MVDEVVQINEFNFRIKGEKLFKSLQTQLNNHRETLYTVFNSNIDGEHSTAELIVKCIDEPLY